MNADLIQDIARAVKAWRDVDKEHRAAVVRLFDDSADSGSFNTTAIDCGDRKLLSSCILNLLANGGCTIAKAHQEIMGRIDIFYAWDNADGCDKLQIVEDYCHDNPYDFRQILLGMQPENLPSLEARWTSRGTFLAWLGVDSKFATDGEVLEKLKELGLL